jgi:lantibiotic transport system permease protein
MLPLIRTEFAKLKRSLALSLCLAAPVCVAGFAALALATADADKRWERFLDEGLTALTVLLAQIEHGARMWNHLLVLPVSRVRLFFAKTVVALVLLLLLQALVYLGLYLAGFGMDAALPDRQLTGDPQFREMAIGLAAMAVGALPMLVLQLWAALRFRSFVPPLVIGILGTFAALVITASNASVYLPWLLPVYATMWPKLAGFWGVWLGVAGGGLALVAMLGDLTRREAF